MRCVLLMVALMLAAVGPARAAPPSVQLEELTWTELRDAVKAGATTIILPVGGTEQSGPQMALGKHNTRARILSGRIAAILGDTLVAPVLAYVPEGSVSPPSGHMRYPGTISIPDAAFKATLEGAARSLRQAGFTHIVLIGDHGDYQNALRDVAATLNREWSGTPVRASMSMTRSCLSATTGNQTSSEGSFPVPRTADSSVARACGSTLGILSSARAFFSNDAATSGYGT